MKRGLSMTPFSRDILAGNLQVLNDRVQARRRDCPRWGWFCTGFVFGVTIALVIFGAAVR